VNRMPRLDRAFRDVDAAIWWMRLELTKWRWQILKLDDWARRAISGTPASGSEPNDGRP
jgi:hypothetical protein